MQSLPSYAKGAGNMVPVFAKSIKPAFVFCSKRAKAKKCQKSIDKRGRLFYDSTRNRKKRFTTQKKEIKSPMKKRYICELCGYEYIPAEGDPDSGIEPGTEFEDLPEDWVCPLCGAGKEDFTVEEIEDEE